MLPQCYLWWKDQASLAVTARGEAGSPRETLGFSSGFVGREFGKDASGRLLLAVRCWWGRQVSEGQTRLDVPDDTPHDQRLTLAFGWEPTWVVHWTVCM